MAKRVERIAIKDLDSKFVSRPRCDAHRYEVKMQSVSEAARLELDQALLANMNYRVHVCNLLVTFSFWMPLLIQKGRLNNRRCLH